MNDQLIIGKSYSLEEMDRLEAEYKEKKRKQYEADAEELRKLDADYRERNPNPFKNHPVK